MDPPGAAAEPLVSIVTPSLNQGRFLEQTIRSVREQDYPRIEHLVADGGSTDGTLELLARQPGVTWWSGPDSGQSEALNEALRRSSGSIVGWLNADDAYLPGAVSAAVEALAAHPRAGLVYGDWVVVGEDGEELWRVETTDFDLEYALNVRNVVPQPSTFIRRAVLDELGFLDPDLHYAMDYDLWLRIARAGYELVHVPAYWAAFRSHPSSKTHASADRFWREERAVMRRHGGRWLSPAFVARHAVLHRLHGLVPPGVRRAVRDRAKRRKARRSGTGP